MKNIKLVQAIQTSFSWCLDRKEYIATATTVEEMLLALDLPKEEILEILEMSSGQDSISDTHIDNIIENIKEG